MLSDCLSGAGIRTVYWIDDKFGDASDAKITEDIRALLLVLKHRGGKDFRHNQIEGGQIDLTADDATIAAQLRDALPGDNMKLRSIFDAAHKKLRKEADFDFDFSYGEFDNTVADLRSKLTVFPVTYAQWNSLEIDLNAAGEDTLFIIDRELGEDVGESGEAILARIVASKSTAHCVMLSQSYSSDEIDGRRKQIAEAHNADQTKFALVSKRFSPTDGNVGDRLASSFRTTFLYRITFLITSKLSDSIIESLEQFIKQLVGLSVYEVDKAIYENSLSEGVSEIDVLLRLLIARARFGAIQTGQSVEVLDRLQRLRRVRAMSPKPDHTLKEGTVSALREWREAEVFSSSSIVNPVLSPLANGDVFEQSDGKAKFVLLAQPCDLVVRQVDNEQGQRVSGEGLFVTITEHNDDGRERGSTFDVKGVTRENVHWRLDFKECFAVNLAVLDFCSFNPEGRVRFSLKQEQPSYLTEHWDARFKKVMAEIAEAFSKNRVLELFSLGASRKARSMSPETTEDTLSFPLQRVGRLESGIAAAALSAWSSFNARAALDHDFARML
jgi:hypothetical protein